MKYLLPYLASLLLLLPGLSCASTGNKQQANASKSAQEILGDSNYLAISYGGYRQKTRDIQPTIAQLKEDMRILSAMDIRLLRTYNVHLEEAANILKAITELKKENPAFEMYVMLGAWIDCKDAWTAKPDHYGESERNAVEIARAVELTKQYPDIIKIIAVGNEAMVKWATAYHVQAGVILKWVNHLQDLKKKGELPSNLWITSSDNFASWGGATGEYKTEDLVKLIKAVDYVSMHTYPMHDTHYNPQFWGVAAGEEHLTEQQKIDAAMLRARDYAISQYNSVRSYLQSLGVEKPIHIGETGWASQSNEFYGNQGSKATDEYKSALYYKHMREWTNKAGISCFYFEAFDEQWKDEKNPLGSENHFGLINLQGQAKYALWELVDKGVFKGLTRDGKAITKTYGGNSALMWKEIQVPPALVNKK
ncbi:MAG: glycosyl hydrolase family 17 protein [Chitinophagaceae bacterium]|nr:glycosyl hydrolase family 17 protein [Chitinophagaceae bacterium]